MRNVSNTTTFITLFYCLGQHVSTITGSSSGPSKVQILKLAVFKRLCGIPNAYILDDCYIKNVSVWGPSMQHVSTITGSSSGPSKIQILKLGMFKIHCGIPNAYILDHCYIKNVCVWDPTTHLNNANFRICILEGPEDDPVRIETCCPKQ